MNVVLHLQRVSVSGIGALLCLLNAQAQSTEVVLRASTNAVATYSRIDFSIEIPFEPADPFDPQQAQVELQILTPGAQTLRLPAFWMQSYQRKIFPQQRGPAREWLYPSEQGWKARFTPSHVGTYAVIAHVSSKQGNIKSEPLVFTSLPSTNRGFVRVSRKDSRFLEFSEGTPFFPVGQNLAFIGNQQYVSVPKADEIFQKLSLNGANYVRVWACCEDWAMAVEARKSAWGRSWNWNPPVTEMPFSEDNSRKCLVLSPERPHLKVEPSHPVALNPGIHYQFSASALTEPASTLEIVVNGVSAAKNLQSQTGTNWTVFNYNFTAKEPWLADVSFRVSGGKAWIADLSLKEINGSAELLWEADVNRPVLGFYNPVDCSMLDELLLAAERNGIYLQLCLLTRDLYMDRLKDASSEASAKAIWDAKKLFRYAVARWGYSPNLAVWEYWNEMNPGLPTDRFYEELGDYLDQVDIYAHLRSTSTWGPSAKDAAHSKLDLADVHFYLRPADRHRLQDEVHAVLDRAEWLRSVAPRKPALLGEFGLADDKWAITEEMKESRSLVDVHNALWASALSGISGTALFWWWERLDQRQVYPMYRPLTSFIKDIPWTGGDIQALAVTSSNDRLRTLGLKAGAEAWLWIFDREAAWKKVVTENVEPLRVQRASMSIQDLPPGTWSLEWWHTREGKTVSKQSQLISTSETVIPVPPFEKDMACYLRLTKPGR